MESKFFKDVWPMLLKSPILLVSFLLSFLMGYSISYLLFDYRKEYKNLPIYLHYFTGIGYVLLMFVILNFKAIFNSKDDFSGELIIQQSLFTVIISFPILFLVYVTVVILRERKKRK